MGDDWGVQRPEIHQHIADQLNEWFVRDEAWTAARVADVEQRLAIDDADKGDAVDHLPDFTLRVLDRAGLIEPYSGPGSR